MNEAGLKILPESIHEWDEVKNSDDPEKFWERISNIRSKFGTGLYQPGKDAGKEDWQKFSAKAVELSGDRLIPRPNTEDPEQMDILYGALGRPKDASGYEFAEIEGAPEMGDERKKFITDLAFDLNLTKSQLKGLDKAVRGADLAANTEQAVFLNDAMTKLKQEWGLAFEDRAAFANKVAKTFFPHLGDTPVLNAAEMVSFHSIAKQLGKASTEFLDQGDQSGGGDTTPAEAEGKINEIRANKEHAYHDSRKPGHVAAKKQMRNLYLAKNGLPPE